VNYSGQRACCSIPYRNTLLAGKPYIGRPSESSGADEGGACTREKKIHDSRHTTTTGVD
jgi:hypothetical protein